jgi:hypothetical protein
VQPVPIDAGLAGAADPRQDSKPETRPDPPSARLAVRSTPSGCEVEVDGVASPVRTPVEDVAMSPGAAHTVKVSCPGREGETQRITLAPGEARALSFNPPEARPVPAKEFGQLKIDTDPWSDIYLGKRKLGTTPLLGIRLPVGTHTLTAVNAELKIRLEFKVTIERNRTAAVYKELRKPGR